MELETQPNTDTQPLKETILKLKTAMTVVFNSTDETYNNVEYITIFINEDENKATFKKKNSNEFIELDLNNLDSNPYGITHIAELYTIINVLEETKMPSIVIPDEIEIITNVFEDEELDPFGTDVLIRELKTYERDFTYLEYKEDILQSLKDMEHKMDVYTFYRLDRKAEFILNNITECNKNRTLPNLFMDNNYHSILKPIVNDSKKIYTDVEPYLNGDIDIPNTYFTHFETEFKAMEKKYEDFFKGIVNRTEVNQHIHTQFEYEDEDGGRPYIKSGGRPYLINTPDTTYYKTTNRHFQDVYRICNPDNPCFSLQLSNTDSMVPKMKLNKRVVDGNTYNLQDIPLDRFITDRNSSGSQTLTCNGTGKVPEHYYSESINKKLHKKSFFNKTLLEPPIQRLFIEGEEINIVGVLLRSIHSYRPTFIDTYTKQKKGNKEDDGFSRKTIFYETNNIGYNLVDHILLNRTTSNIDVVQNHDDISTLDTSQIDYTKHNFIYFNKTTDEELDDRKTLEYLEKIIPSIENIYRIEDTFTKCSNFKQVDKILNKYNLSIFNTHIETLQKIKLKNIFKQNINKGRKYSTLSQWRHQQAKTQSVGLNHIVDSILSEIDDIDQLLSNHDFSPEDPSTYIDLLVESVLNRLSRNTYSIYELERVVVNKLDIYFEYTSEQLTDEQKQLELLYIIITKAVSNKYNLHYYKNHYLQHIIHYEGNGEYSGMIENIQAFYNIDKREFNRLSGDNQSIHLLNKLNKSFDGGKLLYTFFNTILLKKGLDKINNELIHVAKEHYTDSLESWDRLSIEHQLSHVPTIEYIEEEIKRKEQLFIEQKKRYNFYLEKCECFEVVKVYHSLDDIRKDNQNRRVYYSQEFDTTIRDCEIAKTIFTGDDYENAVEVEQLKTALEEVYILDSEGEIRKKIRNIQANIRLDKEEQKRQIGLNEYALLIEKDSRMLYKYTHTGWSPLEKIDVYNKNICLYEPTTLKTIVDMDFDYFINGGSVELSKPVLKERERKCGSNTLNGETKCVPKHLFRFIYTIKKLQFYKQDLANLISNRQRIETDIVDNDVYIETKIATRLYINSKSDIDQHVPVYRPKSTIPMRLWKLYHKALSIQDPDIRLDGINKIITDYGLPYKPSSDGNGMVDTNIYWDYPDTSVVMCCKHYVDLVKMAWLENTKRNKIVEELKLEWCKKNIIQGDSILCDHCGEPVDKIAFSTFEGFTGDDRPMQFREEIIDEEDEPYIDSHEKEVKELLDKYTRMIGVELKDVDIEYIIKHSVQTIKNRQVSLDEYLKGNTQPLKSKVGNFKENVSEGVSLLDPKGVKKMYNEYIGQRGSVKKEDLDFCENVITNKKSLFKFCKYLKSTLIPFYDNYVVSQKISIVLSYMYLTIVYSKKPYIILGTPGLRFVPFNIENVDENKQYLIKDITGHFITNSTDTFFQNMRSDGKKISKFKYEDFLVRHFDYEYERIRKSHTIIQKIEELDRYNVQLDTDFRFISNQEGEWIEFRPLLDISYRYELEADESINTYLQLRDEQLVASDEALVDIQQRLVIIKKNILDYSRKLGYKLISLINSTIHNNVRRTYIQNISYISTCCPSNIEKPYVDYFINNPEFESLLDEQTRYNTFLTNYVYNKTDFFKIAFHTYNTLKDGSTSRTLLDYMYPHNVEDTIDDLKQRILNLNKMIITSLFNDSGQVGRRRIWKQINDLDRILLYDINPEISVEDRRKLLKEKIQEKYPECTEEFIQKKMNILLNYNGKTRVDIVSNQYEFELEQRIRPLLLDKTKNELTRLLNDFATENRKQKVMKNTELYRIPPLINHNDIHIWYKTELEKVQKIGIWMKFDTYPTDIQTVFNRYLNSELTNGNLKKETIRIHNRMFKSYNVGEISRLLVNVSGKLKQAYPTLKTQSNDEDYLYTLLTELGNYDNLMSERINGLDEVLTIEGFEEPIKRELEKDYRKKQIESQYYTQTVMYINNISRLILHTISFFINRLKHFRGQWNTRQDTIQTKYKDHYDFMDNILVKIKETETEHIDTFIKEVTQKMNIETQYKLINILVDEHTRLDCENNELSPLLNTDNITVISRYILMKLLHTIFNFNIDSPNPIYEHFRLSIYYFVFIKNSKNDAFMTNGDIESVLTKYNSRKNETRKQNIDSLANKSVYKLYRKLNLGSIFTDNVQEDRMEEETGNDVHEFIHRQNIENSVGGIDEMENRVYNNELDQEGLDDFFVEEDDSNYPQD